MDVLQFLIAESEYNEGRAGISDPAALAAIDNLYGRLKICQSALLSACLPKYCADKDICDKYSGCECDDKCVAGKAQKLLHEAEMNNRP